MPSRLHGEAQTLYNTTLASQFRLQSMTKDATADMAIGATWPPHLLLDPAGGAKTIQLPAEADSVDLVFIITNTADAAETITVEEDGATTTIGTVAQNASGMFHCDGTTWRKIVL